MPRRNSPKLLDFHTYWIRFSEFCKIYFWCQTIEPRHYSQKFLIFGKLSFGDSYKSFLLKRSVYPISTGAGSLIFITSVKLRHRRKQSKYRNVPIKVDIIYSNTVQHSRTPLPLYTPLYLTFVTHRDLLMYKLIQIST